MLAIKHKMAFHVRYKTMAGPELDIKNPLPKEGSNRNLMFLNQPADLNQRVLISSPIRINRNVISPLNFAATPAKTNQIFSPKSLTFNKTSEIENENL